MKLLQSTIITAFCLPLMLIDMTVLTPSANAYGVCGLRQQTASFRTKSYLITICPGEASNQMVITYLDGTGYKRIAVERRDAKYRGTNGRRNYIVDPQFFIIGIDGQQPIREPVLESR